MYRYVKGIPQNAYLKYFFHANVLLSDVHHFLPENTKILNFSHPYLSFPLLTLCISLVISGSNPHRRLTEVDSLLLPVKMTSQNFHLSFGGFRTEKCASL
jgi:hypothetical protein